MASKVMGLDFNSRVVIITGSSSGIGAQTAVDFAALGAAVTLVGRNEDNLKLTADKCKNAGATSDKILMVVGDVTKKSVCEEIVTRTIKHFGSIHVLVNNAGSVVKGHFMNTSLKGLDEMLDIHVRSVFTLTQLAVPHLIKSKGNIVNISSISGTKGTNYVYPYAVAKAAMNHHTQLLALDLAKYGVRVNSVNPGVIDTPIFVRPGGHIHGQENKLKEFYSGMAEIHPLSVSLGRVGVTTEVSRTIIFLASDAASFITGALIPVDGGRHATILNPKL